MHTLTEADVMVDSLQVTTTSTEELVTKYRASYRPDYSPFFSEASEHPPPLQHPEVRRA